MASATGNGGGGNSVIGIVVGIVLALVVIGFVACAVIRRRQRGDQRKPSNLGRVATFDNPMHNEGFLTAAAGTAIASASSDADKYYELADPADVTVTVAAPPIASTHSALATAGLDTDEYYVLPDPGDVTVTLSAPSAVSASSTPGTNSNIEVYEEAVALNSDYATTGNNPDEYYELPALANVTVTVAAPPVASTSTTYATIEDYERAVTFNPEYEESASLSSAHSVHSQVGRGRGRSSRSGRSGSTHAPIALTEDNYVAYSTSAPGAVNGVLGDGYLSVESSEPSGDYEYDEPGDGYGVVLF
jgi:hypothetical protein